MKRYGFIAAVCLASSLSLSCISYAANEDIKILINETYVECDTSPMIKNDRVLVPLRGVLENIGANVVWVGSRHFALIFDENTIVRVEPDNATAYINNTPYVMDVTPYIINERIMVPIRFISEAFGCDVDWNGTKRTVYVASPSYDMAMLAKMDISQPAASGGKNNNPAVSGSSALVCTADAFVRGGDNASKNYGSDKMLDFKATKDAGYSRDIYLTFDLSPIKGKSVSSANISLMLTDAEDSSADVPITVYACDSFDEGKITMSAAPAAGDQVGQAVIKGLGQWHDIDVTAYINSQLAAGSSSASVVIKDPTYKNKRLIFASRESGTPPVLNVK